MPKTQAVTEKMEKNKEKKGKGKSVLLRRTRDQWLYMGLDLGEHHIDEMTTDKELYKGLRTGKLKTRLMSAKDFKTLTDAGVFHKRGEGTKKIDSLLEQYEPYRNNPNIQAEYILKELYSAICEWLRTHDSGKRVPGVLLLKQQVLDEMDYISKIDDKEKGRLMNRTQFKKRSDLGKLKRRGSTLSTIDDLLGQYDKLMPIDDEFKRDLALAELDTMEDFCKSYLKAHENDPSRAKRVNQVINLLANIKEERNRVKELEFPKEEAQEEERDTNGRDVKVESSVNKLTGRFPNILQKIIKPLQKKMKFVGSRYKKNWEIDIPIEDTGAMISFQLTLDLERSDKEQYESVFMIKAKAGYGIAGFAAIKAGLGAYVSCKASSVKNMVDQIAYGVYRRFRESHLVPREIANWMFGGSKRESGYLASEVWAANIEKNVFGRNANARVASGALATVEGSAGTKFLQDNPLIDTAGVSGSIGASLMGGREYSKESIEKNKLGGKSLEETTIMQLANVKKKGEDRKRGRQQIIGSSVITIRVQGEVSAGLNAVKNIAGAKGSGGLVIDFVWKRVDRRKGGHYAFDGCTIKLDLMASITHMSSPDEKINKILDILDDAKVKAGIYGQKALTAIKKYKDKQIDLEVYGNDELVNYLKPQELIDKAAVYEALYNQEKELIESQYGEKHPDETTYAVRIKGVLNLPRKRPKGFIINLDLHHTKYGVYRLVDFKRTFGGKKK